MGLTSRSNQQSYQDLVESIQIYKPVDPMPEEEKQKLREMYANDDKLLKCLSAPNYNFTEIVDFQRDDIQKMELKLHNLKMVLEAAFLKIKQVRIRKAYLVIGNTGCGKSTLLSALLYGSKVLVQKKSIRNVQIKQPDGTFKTSTKAKNVIDYRDDQVERAFKIGHSNQSETFFPTFVKIEGEEDTYLIDIAGLDDTGGMFLEFINQFINKKLFNLIENLVILIPFTVDAFKVSRGGPVIKQLEILMRTFQRRSVEISKSVIPILTKVKPNDDEFDFDSFQEDMQQIMAMNLDNYLRDLVNNAANGNSEFKITQQDIEIFQRNSDPQDMEPDKFAILQDYIERKEFFESFQERIVGCDPLDRCDDEEQYPATTHTKMLKVDQLKKLIFDTDTFEGGQLLQVSISSELIDKLKKLIEQERNEVKELAEQEYLEITKQYGDLAVDNFIDFPKVRSVLDTLKFFDDEDLLLFIKDEIVSY